jgi:hypothetical protein
VNLEACAIEDLLKLQIFKYLYFAKIVSHASQILKHWCMAMGDPSRGWYSITRNNVMAAWPSILQLLEKDATPSSLLAVEVKQARLATTGYVRQRQLKSLNASSSLHIPDLE